MIALITSLFVAGVQIPRYLSTVTDDTFISLRYAQRLLQGSGLTWNNGEFVEGYSNLLWVLTSAALGALGVDLLHAVWAMGITCTATVFIITTVYFSRRGNESIAGLVVALLCISLSKPIVAWSVMGLEAPMQTMFLCVSLLLAQSLLHSEDVRIKKSLALGATLGLLCLTRPDGALFTAVIALSLATLSHKKKVGIAQAAIFSTVSASFFLGQLTFRLSYYGEWVPNTAHVKIGGMSAVTLGMDYVVSGLLHQRSVWIISLLCLPALALGSRRARGRIALLLMSLFSWLTYVIYIGGDHFFGRRHLVVAIVLLAWLSGEGAVWFMKSCSNAVVKIVTAIIALAMLAGFFPLDQLKDNNVLMAYHDPYGYWKHCRITSCVLDDAFGDNGNPYLATEAAGAYPYYTGWKSLDILGLNDAWLARNPPKHPVSTKVGHTHGNAAYVLKKKPDIVMLGHGYGSRRGGHQFGWEAVGGGDGIDPYPELQKQFLDEYEYLTIRQAHTGTRIRMWIREESAVTGIIRNDSSVFIPGYFFKSNSGMMPIAENGLSLPLEKTEVATYYELGLPPGTWEMRIAPTPSAKHISCFVEEPDRNSHQDACIVKSDGQTSLEISVQSDAFDSRFYGVVLVRIPNPN